MKKIVTFLLLWISVTVSSQEKKHEFYSYYYKLDRTYAPLISNDGLEITKYENGFMIQSYLNGRRIINIGVSYKNKIMFAGTPVYGYKGLGKIMGLETNIFIETHRPLEDFVEAKGVTKRTKKELKLNQIAIFYWRFGTKEPFIKPQIHLFPIQQKQNGYYIDKGDFKEVDIEAVKKDAIKNSKISGTYSENKHNYVKIIELPNDYIYFKLNLFNGRNMGVLDGIIKLSNQSGVFEKGDFGLCKFNIKINKSSVEIKTIDNGYDCGYGGGIRSDGKFPLKSKGTPKLE